MKEHGIQNTIRNALAGDCLAFRANVGQAWAGSRVERLPGNRVLIHDARPFTTGLPPGFSDLFGLMPGGRFFALEVKTPTGRVSDQQARFLAAVERYGGISGVARSPDDARLILGLP